MVEITSKVLLENLLCMSRSAYFHILFWFIFVDIMTGYIKAFKCKKYNSTIGINGLLRHFVVLVVQILVGVYARALGLTSISIGLCVFFIANYGMSTLENAEEIGINFPPYIRKYFAKMKDENDDQVITKEFDNILKR